MPCLSCGTEILLFARRAQSCVVWSLGCSMWGLVAWPGEGTPTLCIGRWSISCWTTRKSILFVPCLNFTSSIYLNSRILKKQAPPSLCCIFCSFILSSRIWDIINFIIGGGFIMSDNKTGSQLSEKSFLFPFPIELFHTFVLLLRIFHVQSPGVTQNMNFPNPVLIFWVSHS